MGKKTDIPALIKSCIVHFELEMIHPFLDGNGRMGRSWQNLLLAKWQPVFEWIPIETLVYKHQKQYYELLAAGAFVWLKINIKNSTCKLVYFS